MSNTIDQYTLLTTEEEKREYAEKEKQKPLILKWIEKFRLCKTEEELSRTAASYCRSVLFQRNGTSKAFFLWDYAFHHPERYKDCLYEVRKEYRKSNGKFYVLQAWYSAEGQTLVKKNL